MTFYRIVVLLVLVVTYSTCFKSQAYNGDISTSFRVAPATSVAESTIVLTSVIFRHGHRTPHAGEMFITDPYYNFTFDPFGFGQLTNIGKQREYLVGQQLRERYDSFIGEYYDPDYLEARSTDTNRTKMSLQLVLAGLFTPKGDQMFLDGLNWQPIPYIYIPEGQTDRELKGIHCPRFTATTEELNNSTEVQAEYSEYKEAFDYIAKNSGETVATFEDAFQVYLALIAKQEWGLELPEWTQSVFPEPLRTITIKQYGFYIRTTERKQMAAGYFIKKLIKDVQEKISDPENSTKKMYLYAAHENTIGPILAAMEFHNNEVPAYGGHIMFELHLINNTYGLKIYYQNFNPDNVELIKLPYCDEFCSLENFQEIYSACIPEDSLCGD